MEKILFSMADRHPIFLDGFYTLVRLKYPQIEIVAAVSNGKEAVEKAEELNPDVVLLDLKMPGMNGPAVLKEIRADYGSLPVIVITGYPDSELMHEALKYSPLMVLAKPIGLHPLLAAMRLALGEGHEGAMHPKANGG